MADIKSLFESIRKLRFPEARVAPSALGERIKESMGDDKAFAGLIKQAAAPRAYTSAELVQAYNTALGRNERFAKSASKKRILDQLRVEREIMLSNDQSRRIIIAHSKNKP